MNILFLNQFFWPDSAATGQLLSDLADQFVLTGDSVTVICGAASYGGKTSAAPPAVKIIRLDGSSFSRNIAGRIFCYLSFLFGALWRGLCVSAPDTVVTLTTPPLLSLVGLAIQKIRGSRHVIWEMDVYPDVAIDLGVLKPHGIAAKLFGWLADLPRRHADRIVVLGECMRTRLLAHGIPLEKILIAENWANENPFAGNSTPAPIGPEGKIILYSGNFGLAHDVRTISDALIELDKRRSGKGGFSFVFAGGGSGNSVLQKVCEERNLRNAVFLPYCDRQDLNARLAAGHIGLVTQKNECLGSAVPSKTYGILAAGRPVLFIGPQESTPARIIAKYNCGWQIECGDVEGLITLLNRLDQHPELIDAAGARAHETFLNHYQRSIGVARIANIIGSEFVIESTGKAQTTFD